MHASKVYNQLYYFLGWQALGCLMVAILKNTALSNYVTVHSSIIGPNLVHAGYKRQIKTTLSTASAILHYYKHEEAKSAKSWATQAF